MQLKKEVGRATLRPGWALAGMIATALGIGAAEGAIVKTFDADASPGISLTIDAFVRNARINASRSAGANTLINLAIWSAASGSQTSGAIYTDRGDVKLNMPDGNTTIGDASADCSAAVLK